MLWCVHSYKSFNIYSAKRPISIEIKHRAHGNLV